MTLTYFTGISFASAVKRGNSSPGRMEKSEEETPQQEQERLLHQVKADNQEISSVEKRYRLPLTHTNLLPLQNKGEGGEVGIL